MCLFCHRITAKDLIHLKRGPKIVKQNSNNGASLQSVIMMCGLPLQLWVTMTSWEGHYYDQVNSSGSTCWCGYQMNVFPRKTFPLSTEVVLLQSLFQWCSVPLDQPKTKYDFTIQYLVWSSKVVLTWTHCLWLTLQQPEQKSSLVSKVILTYRITDLLFSRGSNHFMYELRYTSSCNLF